MSMCVVPMVTASWMKATFTPVSVSRFVPSPMRATSVSPPSLSVGTALLSITRTLFSIKERLNHDAAPCFSSQAPESFQAGHRASRFDKRYTYRSSRGVLGRFVAGARPQSRPPRGPG